MAKKVKLPMKVSYFRKVREKNNFSFGIFEQKCFQKLRMLGPENHFRALPFIKMTVPGVFLINIQFIFTNHANSCKRANEL